MTGKTIRKTILPLLLAVQLSAGQACLPPALADDAEQLKELPGQWSTEDETEKDGEEPQKVELVLVLGEDGSLSFRAGYPDAGYAYLCEGTWSAEFVPDGMDRITFRFTSTDNPAYAGKDYSLECVYHFYTESWVEDDTQVTALILEDTGGEDPSPFADVLGYNGAALYKKQAPNMRVVRCGSYVSLREKRSKTSARLAKVPLGALVLAFPEEGEENGFIRCVYQGRDGYILAEYLEPAE